MNGSAVPPEPVQRSVQKGEGIYESLLLDQRSAQKEEGNSCLSPVQWSVQRDQQAPQAESVQRSVQRVSRMEQQYLPVGVFFIPEP